MAEMIEINNADPRELDMYRPAPEAVLMHWYEPDPGVFITESPKVIERALNGGWQPISFLMERRNITGETAGLIARCPDTPVYTADAEEITALTGFKLVRGALCAMRRRALPEAEELCRNASRIAVLENVVNPTNIGAIFRSAAALGMDAVLLTDSCSDPLYRRSSRVSMGTVFQVPWTYLPGNSADMPLLKKMGFSTAAMALEENSVDIDCPQLISEKRLAVILGAEGDGLSAETVRQSDYTVCIPMENGVDSLNVAAASAVAFWQLGIRRRKPENG